MHPFVTKLTNLLPHRLRPFAKAIGPGLAGLLAALGHTIATGDLNVTEIKVAAEAVALAAIAYLLPQG